MVSGAALVAASVSGCASAFRPSNRLVPGPSGAVGAAPLGQHRIAILSGSATAKGVFIVDLTNGEVQKSFGVTKESTGIAAETPEGPLLLTVGGLSPTERSNAGRWPVKRPRSSRSRPQRAASHPWHRGSRIF